MKKIIKNRIFIVIICGMIFTSLGVYGTNIYESNTIKYSPSDTNWEVNDVSEAINSLYSMKKELDSLKKIGTASSSNILNGKTAVVQGNKVTGGMPNYSNNSVWVNNDNGSFYNNLNYTYTSGDSTNEMVGFKSKKHGYFDSNTSFIFGKKSDIEKMIKSGGTFLGVTGTYTSDATATAQDILKGKTAYVNGNKITGTATDSNNFITKTSKFSGTTNGAGTITKTIYASDLGMSKIIGLTSAGIEENIKTVGHSLAIDVSEDGTSAVLTCYMSYGGATISCSAVVLGISK